MPCDQFRQQIQLDQDLELPPQGREVLEDHLQHCATCAAFRNDLERLQEVLFEIGTSDRLVVTADEVGARVPTSSRRSGSKLRVVSRLSLAAAAVVMISLTLHQWPQWNPFHRDNGATPTIQTRVAQTNAVQTTAVQTTVAQNNLAQPLPSMAYVIPDNEERTLAVPLISQHQDIHIVWLYDAHTANGDNP